MTGSVLMTWWQDLVLGRAALCPLGGSGEDMGGYKVTSPCGIHLIGFLHACDGHAAAPSRARLAPAALPHGLPLGRQWQMRAESLGADDGEHGAGLRLGCGC